MNYYMKLASRVHTARVRPTTAALRTLWCPVCGLVVSLGSDWVAECSGAPCEEGAVYASTGYGFYFMPRTITQRLADTICIPSIIF